nr:hypothetical protein CFP56_48893 [Quercus suber]
MTDPLNHRKRTLEGENSSRMEEMFRYVKREMDELRHAVKDKFASNLDGMIRRTDSPFTTEVLNRPLPPKFHLPQLETFDGLKVPLDHVKSCKTLMHLEMTLDEVMCNAFLTTLKGVARVWFSTISNFEQLSESFVLHFI